ncbi:hypothetical protein V1514DRAFT_281337 [Lipomyces japonicus]|uniref:uncharacterized protein n=1 Tax=Lipomyces japonicus TaxID=56871 RepID=UPI0034CDF006
MPTITFTSSQFRKIIWYSLDNGLDDNALFAAERLVAENPSLLDNVHLLALCHYRAQRYKMAMHVAEDKKHIGCVYVYALSCLKIGKFRLGCRILERYRPIWPKACNIYSHSDSDRQALPDLAAVQCLLGHLYRLFGDSKEAIECYSAALNVNPFLWEAFDGLCKLGVNMRVENIFKLTPAMQLARGSWLDNADIIPGIENSQNQDPFVESVSTPVNDVQHVQPLVYRLNDPHQTPTALSGTNDVTMLGTTATTTPASQTAMVTPSEFTRPARSRSRLQAPDAPRRVPSILPTTRAATAVATAATATMANTPMDNGRRATDLLPTRRSSRLNGTHSQLSGTSTSSSLTAAAAAATASSRLNGVSQSLPDGSSSLNAAGSGGAASAFRGRIRNGLLKSRLASTGSAAPAVTTASTAEDNRRFVVDEDQQLIKVASDDAERVEAETLMLSMYETLAAGLLALSRYDCKSALTAFHSLSLQQQHTPWVLSKIGRAYFEIVRYKEAEEAFAKLRAVDPMRLEDMEIYSTLLWHLRKDVELSFLAHELADVDRNSAQTWVAIGNSFSLQKEHDQALKCFRRASYLDPTFAYAYTLQGHEFIANEEYDSAQNAFRLAMRAEWRHYNAWYGLGMVFLKTGKFELAEQHFRQAGKINQSNAVLICCIGMVLEKLSRFEEALQQYNVACRIQPASALPRFKKARLLMSMRRYSECMTELQIVKDLAPDESSVHYLLGRLYKVQHDKQNAIRHFTAALNLDPKASHVIKEAIEGLETDE